MRHTKIVATLGPASDTDAVLDELMLAGVDVFRFNFSHGTHETHAATYARVRAAADRAGRIVAVMQDLSGPKIRTGRLAGGTPIALRPGDELRIATGDFEGVAGPCLHDVRSARAGGPAWPGPAARRRPHRAAGARERRQRDSHHAWCTARRSASARGSTHPGVALPLRA